MIKKYKGYEYIVFVNKTLGNFCGYVKIPDDYPLIKILSKKKPIKISTHKWDIYNYDELPIDCHGGLTFGEKIEKGEEHPQGFTVGWWIGWDYAHAGDRLPQMFDQPMPRFMTEMGRIWTAKDVENECKNVIKQLIAKGVKKSDKSK